MFLLVKDGNTYNTPIQEFVCDDESDKSNIPTADLPMGSKCYVIANSARYILNSSKEWIKQGGEG